MWTHTHTVTAGKMMEYLVAVLPVLSDLTSQKAFNLGYNLNAPE